MPEAAVRMRAVREPPLQAYRLGLGRSEYCFEDGCGRATEGIGGGEARLVGNGGDEVSGFFVVQSPGVEAHGDDGRWFDEGCYLFVEAGRAGGGGAGHATVDFFFRVGGAQA